MLPCRLDTCRQSSLCGSLDNFSESLMNVRSVAAFSLSLLMPLQTVVLRLRKTASMTLRVLLQRAESSDIVVVAGDMSVQVGRLSTDEAQLGGCFGFGLDAQGQRCETSTTVCRPQSTFMQHKLSQQRSHLATWCPPTAGQP